MDLVEDWKIGLGMVIRRQRQEKALSQESFAHDVGVTRNAIQKLERGTTNVSFENLIRVALALQSEPADLLGEVASLISNSSHFAHAKAQIEGERKTGRPTKALPKDVT